MTRAENVPFVDLVHRVQQTDLAVVETTLDGILTTKTDRAWRVNSTSENGIDQKIDLWKAQRIAPPWMNINCFLYMVAELSTEKLWKKFIDEDFPTLKDPTHPFNKTYPYTNTPGDLAYHVARSDAPLMTANISLGLLAAAIPQIDTIRKPPVIVQSQQTWTQEIAARFPDPPTDADAFMDRVKILVPNPDTTSVEGEGTLLRLMKDHNVFGRCPAQLLTERIMRTWGKKLDTDPIYESRFKKTITKPH
jgi:hypothetical protein